MTGNNESHTISINITRGNFYFNRTPMGPPGYKIIVHGKPGKRGSWGFHGVHRFYIGPLINGYHTYKVYNPNMRSEQSSDTVKSFHNQPKFPSCQQQMLSQIQLPIYDLF